MPKNTPTGFVIAFFAVTFGFAMIWHIWWMAGVGALGIFVTMLAFGFRRKRKSRYLPSRSPGSTAITQFFRSKKRRLPHEYRRRYR
jgi:ABC-type Fe3+-siderophore transport system permease subunit